MNIRTNHDESPLAAVAQALCDARLERSTTDVGAHLNALQAADDAYAVQRAVATHGALKLFADRVPRHWKSGGANRDSAITHAPLPDAGVWASPANAGAWPFHVRLVEAEIALRLGREVTEPQASALTADSAHAFIDAMTVSIEIVDTRWQQPLDEVPALLKLADMGVHGALVLGDWVAYQPTRDWAAQRCSIRIGGADALMFTGTHSLGDPAWLLVEWLRDVTRWFGTVPAGTVVTTGNWVGMLTARAGDLVQAEFDGIGRASLQL